MKTRHIVLISVDIKVLALRYTNHAYVHNKCNNLYRQARCIKTFQIIPGVRFSPRNEEEDLYQFMRKHNFRGKIVKVTQINLLGFCRWRHLKTPMHSLLKSLLAKS